jgi:hypothetical protein
MSAGSLVPIRLKTNTMEFENMKVIMLAALLVAQFNAVGAPVRAAELIAAEQPGTQQVGAFAGARLRLPLGGHERQRARVALSASPTLHQLQPNGEWRARIGRGLELGGRGDRPLLTFAGRPVGRLAETEAAPDGTRRNISPVGWVAIGVGALALIYLAAFGICQETNCLGSE